MDVDYCILARPEHPLANKKDITLNHITQYQWLEFTPAKAHTFAINEFLLKNEEPVINVALESNLLRVLSRFLQEDDYLILSPKAIVEKEFDAVPLNIDLPFLNFSTGAFFLKSSYNLPYVRNVLNLISTELKGYNI